VKQSGCVPGCSADSDCAPGEHCYVCGGTCFKSKAVAQIGDWCQSDSDCAPFRYCAVLGTSYGFCSQNCYGMNSNCVISYNDPCPKGSSCLAQTEFCVIECPSGGGCGVGFHCIDPGTGSPLCLPGCGTTSDCAWAHGTKCVQGSMGLGSCLFPDGGIVLPPGADAGAGEDAAQPPPDAAAEGLDAGLDAAGPILAADATAGAGEDAGGSSPTAVDGGDKSKAGSGCGCASSTGSGPALLTLFGLACILGRRRRAPSAALD